MLDVESANVGAPIIRDIVVLAVSVPAVPLIVMGYVPGVAVLDVTRVRELLPAAGFVANDAVTPAGNPVADNVTTPLNPY